MLFSAPILTELCLLCSFLRRSLRQLGDSYGIPKVHYRGVQDNFYIMVGNGHSWSSSSTSLHPRTRIHFLSSPVSTVMVGGLEEAASSLSPNTLPSLWLCWTRLTCSVLYATQRPCSSHLGDSVRLRRVQCAVQIMDILGPSLWDVWNQNSQHLSEAYVACVAIESLTILQALHAKG